MVKSARPKPRKLPRQFFKLWREHKGLTQERALDRLGWSQSKLSRIESGTTIWNALDLADLEEAYGVSRWNLLNVDPTKDGEVVDLMGLLDDSNRETVTRMLRAAIGK